MQIFVFAPKIFLIDPSKLANSLPENAMTNRVNIASAKLIIQSYMQWQIWTKAKDELATPLKCTGVSFF